MGEAVLALGTGVVQGMAGRKQQSEKDEYFKAQKKLLNAQVDMEQRKASMFEKLPPEEQARVLFGQAPTSKADELKGIFDLLGGAQGGPPAAEPPMDTGPFPTTMGGPITLPGGDLIDTMAGMKTEGMMPGAPGGPGGLNIPPGMEGIVNSMFPGLIPKQKIVRLGDRAVTVDDYGKITNSREIRPRGTPMQITNPDGSVNTIMANPYDIGFGMQTKSRDRLLTPTELAGLIDPSTGKPPPVGTMLQGAIAGGYMPKPTAFKETQKFTQNAVMSIVDRLNDQVNVLFTSAGPVERLVDSGSMNLQSWLQTEKGADFATYQALTEGVLSNIVRYFGERGALTDRDIERARNLLPKLLPVPDTREVATKKMDQLRELIMEISNRSGLAPGEKPYSGAATGLPPAAVAKLREGAKTRFGNGQVWTLKNGQPVRVIENAEAE